MGDIASRRIGSVGPGAVNLMGENRDGGKGDEEHNRVAELQTKIYDANSAQEDWRPMAIESYQFTGNQQWRDADIETLKKNDRPIITINKVLPKVQFLSGLQRQQRTEPSFTPVEGNDVRTAEIIRALYKHHQQRGRAVEEDNSIFEDSIISGIGWKKIVLKFDGGDVEGRPCEIRRHPLSIFPDPNFWDGGLDQMRYVIDAVWVTKKEAKSRWPDYADEIESRWGEWLNNSGAHITAASTGTAGEAVGDSLADQRFFWDPEQQRCRIAEIWELEIEERDVALMPDGNVEDDPQTVKRIKAAITLAPELADQIVVTKSPVGTVTVSHLLDNLLLSDRLPSPFNEPSLPFFPTICHKFWRVPFGIVEPIKDLQREYNVHRCAIMEMVKKSPNTGWLNNKNGGAKTADIVEYAKGSGSVINHEGQEPKRIDPPVIPQTLVLLQDRADQDMKDILVIHDEMTGQSTQKTVSGRAIEARQRGGITVQEPILESFRLDMQHAAKFQVKAIQQYTTVAKAAKIIGQVAAREPGNQALQAIMQQQMELQAVLENAMATEFDVLIRNEQPYEPSLKQQNFASLAELATQYPQNPPPPQVMIRAAKEAGVIQDQDAAEWLASVEAAMAAQQPQPPPEQF